MARHELKIQILDERYVDRLITALVRQGYSAYYNSDKEYGRHGIVCITVDDDDLTKLREEG
jgi:hypothetical protein